MKAKLWRVVAVAAVATLAAGCASFDAWQRKQIFQHERSTQWAQAAPAGTQDYALTLANGDGLHAWYLPAGEDAPTVLYLHGARRSLNGSVPRIERLHGLGFNVLAVDYRGFGQSTPLLPSEASALEDAQAAFAELARRQPDPARRFVYGYSLGGALAIALAAEHDGLAGVIVESSFTSIADVVRERRGSWLPFIDLIVTQPFDSLARIGRVDEPLLLIHGTSDGVIPHTMSDRLLAAATAAPVKQLLKVPGANHRSTATVSGAEYDRALREFAALGSARLAATAAPATP
jgi:pimeloyl-ACP methyl ester carboxylesterase